MIQTMLRWASLHLNKAEKRSSTRFSFFLFLFLFLFYPSIFLWMDASNELEA